MSEYSTLLVSVEWELVLMVNSARAMNWTCLVYGGPMTFILVWWCVSARKWFKGPKYVVACTVNILFCADDNRVNIEHQMLGRPEAAIEGLRNEGSSSSASSMKDGKGVDGDKVGKMA